MNSVKKIVLNEGIIISLIIINSLIIFMQGFEMTYSLKHLLSLADNIITFIFVVELVVKVSSLGFKRFIKNGWNTFDAILILLALPSLLQFIFSMRLENLDYLLVFRVLRVFKFIRLLRFVPNMDQLIKGVKRAMKASVIILIGFFVYNFVISVLSCFLFRSAAPEYFKNPLVSFYSIFRIFTTEGWYEIPKLIAQRTSIIAAILTKLYFVILLITGGIFGLSLVNSIFVDAMVSDNNDELERKVESIENKINQMLNHIKRQE